MTRISPMPLPMNEVFVDTSALYALLVETDDNHRAARTAASSSRDRDARLVTSSFVVLETVTLLQTRAGIAAVRIFYRDVLPLLTVAWVGEEHLHRAMAALLGASKRGVSLTGLVEHHAHAGARDSAYLCVRRGFRTTGLRARPRERSSGSTGMTLDFVGTRAGDHPLAYASHTGRILLSRRHTAKPAGSIRRRQPARQGDVSHGSCPRAPRRLPRIPFAG